MGFDPITMGLGAGVSLLSGFMGAGASKKASEQQIAARERALQMQKGMFDTAAGALNPFISGGANVLNQLSGLTGPGGALTTPTSANLPGGTNFSGVVPNFNFQPTQEQLEQTPGYQFNLNQGLKAVQNSAAARGLGSSGTAMKGAADYAQGLAGTTFQQQLQNYLQQGQMNFQNTLTAGQQDWQNTFQSGQTGFQNYLQQNRQIFDLLFPQAQLGAGSAASLAGAAGTFGKSMGDTMTGIGDAGAAGTLGETNAWTNALLGGAGMMMGGTGGKGGLAGLFGGLFGGKGVGMPLPTSFNPNQLSGLY